MADPGRYLSRDIRAGKIILRIAGRDVFTVSGDIDKGKQVQRSNENEGDGCKAEFFHGTEGIADPLFY